jgi:enterochelin esterase-like enzyme
MMAIGTGAAARLPLVAAVAAHRVQPPGRHPRLVHLVRIPSELLHQLGQSGPLESPWLAVGLTAVLVASIAIVIWLGRRRRRSGVRPRHRSLRRAGFAIWVAVLTVLGVSAAVNAYVGYIPTVPALLGTLPGDPVGSRSSRVDQLRIGAPTLGIPSETVYVYLPPGYDAHANARRRYPVVYLLHGYPGGPLDWFRGAEVQHVMDALLRYQLVQPMILVVPNANGGWLLDSEMLNQVGGPQVETYLTSTVVAAIDSRYRTVADRAGRAIGGMSSGGYGALNLGLRHQDRFSVILAQMPYGDPGNVTRILLGGSRALWQANSPRLYIPTMTFHHPMAVYLIAGSRDPQLGEARRLAAMLTGRGQVAVVKAVPGATHSWRGARAEIPYSLVFASQQLHGGSSGGHQLLADATARLPALTRS